MKDIPCIIYFYVSAEETWGILNPNRDFSTPKRFVTASASETFITNLFPTAFPYFLSLESLLYPTKVHKRNGRDILEILSLSVFFFSFVLKPDHLFSSLSLWQEVNEKMQVARLRAYLCECSWNMTSRGNIIS